jgi:hypothetical protein
MPYRIAGIDVHKKMLAVVVADVAVDGDFQFERQKVGTSPSDLRGLAAKGTIFAVVYRRIVPRLGHAQAIGAITHRLCRLIWKSCTSACGTRNAGRPSAQRRRKCVRAR